MHITKSTGSDDTDADAEWIRQNTKQERYDMENGEKIYKTMSATGVIALTAGIIIVVVGVVTGVMTIVSGAMLLGQKKNVLF